MWSEYSAQTWFATGHLTSPDITASDGLYTDGIALSWSESTGADIYRVYRNTTDTTSGRTQVGGDIHVTNITDKTVIPGRMYYYWVQAGKNMIWSGLGAGDSGYALFAASEESVWKYKDGKTADMLKGKMITPTFTPNLIDGWQIGMATRSVDGTLTNFSGPYTLENLKNKNKVWLLKRKKELIIKYKAKKDILTYKLWDQMPESKVVYLINPDTGTNQLLSLELKGTEPGRTSGWQILIPVILSDE